MADIFCTAAIQLADELKIKLVISCGITLFSLQLYGIPEYYKSLGKLGFEGNLALNGPQWIDILTGKMYINHIRRS